MMDKELYKHIEHIDASVFSGDKLWDVDNVSMLKQHCERWLRAIKAQESMYDDIRKERKEDLKAPCKYCGGTCPQDEEHACDGYLGDIDDLYRVATLPEDKNYYKVETKKGKTFYISSESDYKHDHGLMMEARSQELISVFDSIDTYEKISYQTYIDDKPL